MTGERELVVEAVEGEAMKSNSEADRRPRPRLTDPFVSSGLIFSGALPGPVLPYQTLNT